MSSPGEEEEIPEVLPVRRRREVPEAKVPDIGQDPMMRMVLPVGTSLWAIASGYLGLFSVLCLPAPLALLTGILALVEIRRNPLKHGMGRAIFGIIMGTLGSLGLLMGLISFVAELLRK
jgi:hypothetical protein